MRLTQLAGEPGQDRTIRTDPVPGTRAVCYVYQDGDLEISSLVDKIVLAIQY